MLLLLSTLLLLPHVVEGQAYGYSVHVSEMDCAGKTDGVAVIGCDGYLECVNSNAVKHICDDHQHFDRDTMSCLNSTDFASGCSHYDVCDTLDDGSYPDPEKNCQTYYTCFRHNFLGHQYCPKGLVFNSAYQICDWPTNVLFPCGTKQEPPVG